MKILLLVVLVLAVAAALGSRVFAQQTDPRQPAEKVMEVQRTDDFTVDGSGQAAAWKPVPWVPLSLRTPDGPQYQTRVKMLYSQTGVYVLMEAEDRKLTTTMREDFLSLWKEDVFEFFFWPDERHTVYFEYEISPMGFELPIMVPNFDGEFSGWRPVHYVGERKTQKATTVTGGQKLSGAEVTGWKAEVFVPYKLLSPLQNVPPRPGTRWRANFYRMDYDDDGKTTGWDWARVGESFHEYQKFGTLVFQ